MKQRFAKPKQKDDNLHPLDLPKKQNKLNDMGSHSRYVAALTAIEPNLSRWREELQGMTVGKLSLLLAWAIFADPDCAVPAKSWVELISIWRAWYEASGRRLHSPVFVNHSERDPAVDGIKPISSDIDWDYTINGEWKMVMQEGMWGVLVHFTGVAVPLKPPLPSSYYLTQNFHLEAVIRDSKSSCKVDVKDVLSSLSNCGCIPDIPKRIKFTQVGNYPANHILQKYIRHGLTTAPNYPVPPAVNDDDDDAAPHLRD